MTFNIWLRIKRVFPSPGRGWYSRLSRCFEAGHCDHRHFRNLYRFRPLDVHLHEISRLQFFLLLALEASGVAMAAPTRVPPRTGLAPSFPVKTRGRLRPVVVIDFALSVDRWRPVMTCSDPRKRLEVSFRGQRRVARVQFQPTTIAPLCQW